MIYSIHIMQIITILVGCAIASIQDIKTGLIANRLTCLMSCIGIAANIMCFCIKQEYPDMLYIKETLIVIVLSVLLYSFRIWAGGDAKLSIAIACLFPYSVLELNIQNHFTFLWFFVFTFGGGIVYLVIETAVIIKRKKIQISFREIIQGFLKQISCYIKTVIFVSALNYLYFTLLNDIVPTIVYVVMCILFVRVINKCSVFRAKITIAVFLIFDVSMFCITGYFASSINIKSYIIIAVFFMLRCIIEKFNYETIETENVKKGDVLSYASSLMMQNSKILGLPMISDETLASRITESEAKSIVQWGSSKHGQSNIVIVKKLPFALFINLGVLLYIIVGRLI